MADPVPYLVNYSFSGFQASAPAAPLPAARVDAELASAAFAIDSLVNAVKDVRRPDGKLQTGSVGFDQLSPELNIGFSLPSTWAQNTNYTTDSTVFYGNQFLKSNVAHNSGAAFDASKWTLIVDFGDQAQIATSEAQASADSATAAAASASSAATHDTNAASSATAASNSAADAATSATAASSSATAASNSATAAAGSATSASGYATAASNSATAAAGSETAAAGSATAAANSATDAANSATTAAAAAAAQVATMAVRFDAAQALSGAQKTQARSNLGLAAVASSGAYSDLAGLPTLGTAAALAAGTAVGNLVQVQTGGKLPALDGSLLTNISAGTALTNVIRPEDYGAKGDGVVNASGGAITAGTNSFTQSGYAFVAGDIGKYIAIDGAGASGACLVTTISNVSGGAAILAVNASTPVSGAASEWGTDDSTALVNMASACGNKAIWFGAGKVYLFKGNTFRFGSDNFVIYGNNAQVRLMASASGTDMGMIMADSTWLASGPSNWTVKDLRYYGNRTRRISSGSMTAAVKSDCMIYAIGCRNFNIVNCYSDQAGGDSFYVGGGHSGGRTSAFFNYHMCVANDAGRNGFSIVGALYGNWLQCQSQNHTFGAGHTNISYGWDFEPDAAASANQAMIVAQCTASNCTTVGFGSNIANGTNTKVVWGNCYAEACGTGFFESASGSVKVFAAGLSGNTTNFTNLTEKISGF